MFVPAIESAGIVTRRANRDNEGGRLNAEIVDLLNAPPPVSAQDLLEERQPSLIGRSDRRLHWTTGVAS
jgi:hypothetical protein